jgi:hypothetical protein
MQPWLSSSVLRCAIVLSLGWLALGTVVMATSGAFVGDAVPSMAGPAVEKLVFIDTADPCAHDALGFDGQVIVNAASTITDNLLHTSGVVTLTGVAQTGPYRDGHDVAAAQRFSFKREIERGLMEPADVRLPVANQPEGQVTQLTVRLQAVWDGAQAAIKITDLYLVCAPASDTGAGN